MAQPSPFPGLPRQKEGGYARCEAWQDCGKVDEKPTIHCRPWRLPGLGQELPLLDRGHEPLTPTSHPQ